MELIQSVDPVHVIRGNLAALQNIIPTLAYCDYTKLNDTNGTNDAHPQFIKLCQIMQNAIQYLMFTQKQLKQHIAELKKNLISQKENEDKALKAVRKIQKQVNLYEQLNEDLLQQESLLKKLVVPEDQKIAIPMDEETSEMKDKVHELVAKQKKRREKVEHRLSNENPLTSQEKINIPVDKKQSDSIDFTLSQSDNNFQKFTSHAATDSKGDAIPEEINEGS